MRKKKGGDDWRRLERHRLSAGYPDLTGQAWEDFKANLREHGLNGRKIVLYEGKVLDGWQLQRACVDVLERDAKPDYRQLPKGRDPQQFVWEANEFRRHESEQAMERRVAARRQYAAELEANGDSVRQIAAKTGTSQTQARRDLEEHKRMSNSGVPQGTPGNDISESVNGTGGPSQGEDKTLICDRCKRVSKKPLPGCERCEGMRKAAAKQRAEGRQKKRDAENAAEKLDAFKNPVPVSRQDAMFDPWIQDGIDTLAKISEQFRTARLGERMQKKAKRYPFFDPKDFADGCGFVIQYLDHLLDHLKDNRPAGVCPECKGLGCGACRMSGLVPRNLYAELAK